MGKDYKWQNTREVPNSWLTYPVHQFKLKIPQEMINKDIFVLLTQSNDTRQQIKLHLSQSEQMKLDHVNDCRFFDLELCNCQQSQINSYCYFFVFCKMNCYYQLDVMTENMNDFLRNEIMLISTNQIEGKLAMVNLTNIEYERCYIRLMQIDTFSKLSIYINMNETIPTIQEFDVQYQIDRDKYLFFQNNFTQPINTISTLIKGGGKFLLQFKTYKRIQEISLYQNIKDSVIKDGVNYYKLIIEDFKDNILIFEMIPSIEKIIIYIQPCIEDRCSNNYRDFEWQFQFDQEYHQFIIPPYKMIYTKVYLIAINTEYDDSSYRFQIKINYNIKERLMTQRVFQGILQKNQIALFLLEPIINEKIDRIVDVFVNYPKGHGIILSKQCIKDEEEIQIIDNIYEYLQQADSNNYYNCSITQEQASLISQDHLQTQNTFQFHFNSSEFQINVPKIWFESQSYNFQYAIAIQSYVESMRFSLEMRFSNPSKFITLNQFTINYSLLKELNTIKYQFYQINQHDQILFICIATYQGEQRTKLKTFSSYDNNFIKKRVRTLDLDILQYYAIDSYTYSLQIQATKNLRYSITQIMSTKFDIPIKQILLIQAIPFKTIDLNLYFHFEITQVSILYINLKSLQGNFICYILSSNKNFGNQFPNETNFTLTSTQQTLIIENPKQFNYLHVKSISLEENESYQIMYYYNTSHLELFLANTFYGFLNDNQSLYFYYQSSYQHSKLYIIKTYLSEYSDENNLQIYISLNNNYPNEFNFQYQIQPSSYYISIPNLIQDTILYIGVYSKGSNKYSILIQEENSSIQLKDNIIQISPTLEQQNYYFYYFIPKYFNQSIKIQAFTRSNLIELLCNIIQFDSQHIEKENYPTNQNYKIKELFSSNPSNKLLFINTTDLIQCKDNGCLLLINAYILGHFDHFNIMVSSKYTLIRNLEMIIGYSTQNKMSYYYFNIVEHMKDIQISVRAIQDCDCDIYLLKSQMNTQILYPSVDQYTYKFDSDTLIISEDDNIGQYMIGVLAQDCMYEVLLHLGGFQMNYIHNGQIIDTFIDDTIQYFYFNNHQEPFRIMIYDIKNIKVSISIKDKSELLELQNNENLFGGIIQIDKDLCSICIYNITLYPIRPTVVSLILTYNTVPLTIKYGRTYYDHCLNICEFNLEPGELNLFVYSKSIKLTFHSKINQVTNMNLTYSNYIIPINQSCILRINQDSYYSINLNNQEIPITLILGKEFNGRNMIGQNQRVFIFQIERIDLEYIIQVSSKSDIFVDVYYDNNTKKILPKIENRINNKQRRLIYQFKQIERQYKIILQCIDYYHISVDIYNQNQIKYINFNNHYLEIIDEIQQYNIQAIQEQDIQFQKIDCLGKTSLLKSQYVSSRDIFFKIQVTDRMKPFPFNIFSLVPHIQYSHDQWYFKNTRFEIIKQSKDSLEVKIFTMKRKKTGNLNLNKLIYKLHLSDQDYLMKALGCEIDIELLQNYTGISIFYTSIIQEVKEKEESLQFTVLINRELIYGLLVFQAYYESYDIPYTYFYNVSVIYNQSETIIMKDQVAIEDSKIDYILIVFGISIILAISLICIWICMPKKKQKKREFNEQQQQQQQQQYQQQQQQQQQELQSLKQSEQELVNIN
ncbi:unnamed protein product [Paramecium pentaurelia]|uniref:Transmembrane protein n=1 Tax=Paramecium pentaurelia TaxID=43138 RepID=A0A8S1UCC3_9CILI|nr:unnamed protein product [Paramecium pentaurelia]